jgi:hypothetical protein
MPIQELTTTRLLQRCALCDAENTILLTRLLVGVENGEHVDDSIVPLPECPTCHSREFLVRSSKTESEAVRPEKEKLARSHRLLVDALHAELVKQGRVIGRLKEKEGLVFTRLLDTETEKELLSSGLKLTAGKTEARKTDQ